MTCLDFMLAYRRRRRELWRYVEVKHKEAVVVGCAFCANYQGSEEVHAVFIHSNINCLC